MCNTFFYTIDLTIYLLCSFGVANLVKTKTQSDQSSINVLHVDDEQGFLDTSKKILELQGQLKVTSASSVTEGLKLVKKENFDVIVSDYEMPETNGLEFLKIIRDQDKEIPFLLFTGKGREEVAINALNLGADGYLNKFGSPETVYGELVHAIQRASKLKKQQIELIKSEERYRTVVENANQAILLFQNGYYRFANKKAVELSGYTIEELLSISPLSLVHPDDIDHVSQLTIKYQQLRKKGSKVPQEEKFRFITKKGKTKWVHLKTILVRWEGKTAALNFFTDITKEKKTEEALHESQKRHQLINETITDAIFIQDMNLRVTYVSPSVKTLSGYTSEEVMNLKTEDFMTPESYARGVSDFVNALNLGKQGKDSEIPLTVYEYIRKDGSTFWGELRTNLIRDDKGNLIGLQGTLRDITERKQSEFAMKDAMARLELLNEKLEVVSKLTRHDSRNKLAAILNNIYLAKQEIPENSNISKYFTAIESATDQLEKIFEFSKIYEVLGTEKIATINVKEKIDEAVLLANKTSEIIIENKCNNLTVKADSLLRQLFYNLLDNSLQHGEHVTKIKVYYKNGKENTLLFYEDDGIGIPEHEKEIIFKEGYGKGTGYGLFLIQKICEVYGWTIKEEGEQGKGAKFIITIPKIDN